MPLSYVLAVEAIAASHEICSSTLNADAFEDDIDVRNGGFQVDRILVIDELVDAWPVEQPLAVFRRTRANNICAYHPLRWNGLNACPSSGACDKEPFSHPQVAAIEQTLPSGQCGQWH